MIYALVTRNDDPNTNIEVTLYASMADVLSENEDEVHAESVRTPTWTRPVELETKDGEFYGTVFACENPVPRGIVQA